VILTLQDIFEALPEGIIVFRKENSESSPQSVLSERILYYN